MGLARDAWWEPDWKGLHGRSFRDLPFFVHSIKLGLPISQILGPKRLAEVENLLHHNRVSGTASEQADTDGNPQFLERELELLRHSRQCWHCNTHRLESISCISTRKQALKGVDRIHDEEVSRTSLCPWELRFASSLSSHSIGQDSDSRN